MNKRLLEWAKAFEPELRELWRARRAFSKSLADLEDLDYYMDTAALRRIQNFGEKVGNQELQLGAKQLLQSLNNATAEYAKTSSTMDASWACARLAVLDLTVRFEGISFSDAAKCLDDDGTESFEDYMESVMDAIHRVLAWR